MHTYIHTYITLILYTVYCSILSSFSLKFRGAHMRTFDGKKQIYNYNQPPTYSPDIEQYNTKYTWKTRLKCYYQ